MYNVHIRQCFGDKRREEEEDGEEGNQPKKSDGPRVIVGYTTGACCSVATN